jgi:hypothetical protein
MASFSDKIGDESNFHFEFEEDIHQVTFDYNIPKYKGVPCRLWTTKCVSLHNDNGVAAEEGICHSVSSNLTIETTRSLWDMHVSIHI